MRPQLTVATLYTVDFSRTDADSRALALLSSDEKERMARFVFDKNRHEYLLAHALVRLALSRHAPSVAPEDWRFDCNQYGRPEVAGPDGAPRLVFNLSHTDGLGAVLVADAGELGVDVEAVDRRTETVAIADRYFAPAEVAALRALPVEKQRDRFFVYWTLKESYIKARGMGLALPLDGFAFDVADETPRLTVAPALADDGARWRFTLRRPTPRHLLATAVAGGPDDVREGPSLL